MAKRLSGQTNTLFNYFQSPSGKTTKKNNNSKQTEAPNLKNEEAMDTGK